MIRIIIGPDVIKKSGLDRVGKVIVRRLRKLRNENITNENKCEILFLAGVAVNDINYLLRNMLRLLDMVLTIKTEVDPDTIGNSDEFKIIIKVT